MSELVLTRLQTGKKYIVQHLYFKSDGQTGDLDSSVIIDPAAESMAGFNRYAIDDVTWAFNGFSANIHFELLVSDTPAWVFPPSSGNSVDFTTYGGIVDRGSIIDGTGKILISTTGFGSAGDEGSMIIRVRKHK